MDGFDKLINNRAPLKMIFTFILVVLFSAAVSWFASAFAADIITEYIIRSNLSAIGGGRFTALPDSSATAQGEALLTEYSISADLPPRLMECWDDIRVCCFSVFTAICVIISTIWLIASIRSLFGIYNQIEMLRSDCLKLAENASHSIAFAGEDFSCVRRLSESLILISERLSYLTAKLQGEKEFLNEFLTDFSHQLKTSLAVVRLNSDILYDMDNLSEEKKRLLSDEIQQNLDGMESLVINTIKLAKLNADSVIYSKTETDISATCSKAISRISPLLRDRNITVSFSDDERTSFPHDRIWLCEAFENIIKNSADHSECSDISIAVTSNPALTTVAIEDNGKGIPQHEIPYLFRRFGKKSGNIRMTSAGVGMSISKKIVQAHNGEIIVYSEPDKGTRFEISFLNT